MNKMGAADIFLNDFRDLITNIADLIPKIQTISTGTAVFLAGLLIAIVLLYGETKNRWEWKLFPCHIGSFLFGIILVLHLISQFRGFHYDGYGSLLVGAGVLLIYFIELFIALFVARILLIIFLRLTDGKNYEFDQHGNVKTSYKYWELFFNFAGWMIFFIEYKSSFENIIFGWF